MKNEGLTDKQNKFADAYHLSGNATESAIKAGYSSKGKSAEVQGSVLLRNPKVRDHINKLKKSAGAKHIITRDKILDKLSGLMDNEDPKVQLKAIEVANKMCGFNEPEKQDVTGSLDVNIMYQVVGSREDVDKIKGEL